MSRIYLSPPNVGEEERDLLLEAFASNWIAPLGPHVDAFESEIADTVGVSHAVALSSGTAALHLSMVVLGVRPGDDVLVPTLTFVATANAVRYVGARPIFVDSEETSWNIDPVLVEEEIERRIADGAALPAACLAVDLYGQCADYARLLSVCRAHKIPVIEDAAEALGASYGGKPAGSLGDVGVFSFNGNKIVTTSGGGMLVTNETELAEHARHLASQARKPAKHYEHDEVGFNYRLSNLLAAVGRAQLANLHHKVERLRYISECYQEALGGFDGVSFMPEAGYGRSTRWLTVALVDPVAFGADRDRIISALEAMNIEARPAWKPMHQQQPFLHSPKLGGAVAERIFGRGVCLPGGSGMTDSQLERVVQAFKSIAPKGSSTLS